MFNMKITLDTDKIKIPSFSLSKYSDREVFFMCVAMLLSAYTFSDWLDSRNMIIFNSRLNRVEVTLDKIVDRINSDILNDEEVKVNKPEKNRFTRLHNTGQTIKLTKKEFDCLSRNIYFEAKFEPYIGKIAVANVTHNRLLQKKWGDDFCKVINAKKQFSWRLFKHMREEVPKGTHWEAAKHAALMFTRGVRVVNLEKSDHYYASYIKPPKWSFHMKHVADIGLHKFYSSY